LPRTSGSNDNGRLYHTVSGDARLFYRWFPGSSAPPAPGQSGAARPTGAAGYWMAGADGSVYAFGSAGNLGSLAGTRLTKPIVTLAATPTGQGYWLVATDGGIFAFGDATFLGSAGDRALQASVVTFLARR
jgi:hypothetical protein